MSQLTKVGILGAGSIARHHVEVVHALGGEVIAACTRRSDSPNWTKFVGAAPEVKHLRNVEEVLASPEVEAVIACLDWQTQTLYLEKLLACPKPILLEKPIGLSAGPTRAIVQAAGEFGKNKLVGYNRRYYEPINVLNDRISQGGLKAVDVVVSENIGAHVERHGPEIVEHLLPFTSAHTLDLMLYMLGRVKILAVRPYRQTIGNHEFVSYNGLLETETGVPVHLALNANDPSPVGMRCRFDDDTTWHLSPLETLTLYQGVDIILPSPEFNIRQYQPKIRERYIVDATLKPGFKEQGKAFLSGKYGQGADLEAAVSVLDLIESIVDCSLPGEGIGSLLPEADDSALSAALVQS